MSKMGKNIIPQLSPGYPTELKGFTGVINNLSTSKK
jgi:hypothetical protein